MQHFEEAPRIISSIVAFRTYLATKKIRFNHAPDAFGVFTDGWPKMDQVIARIAATSITLDSDRTSDAARQNAQSQDSKRQLSTLLSSWLAIAANVWNPPVSTQIVFCICVLFCRRSFATL